MYACDAARDWVADKSFSEAWNTCRDPEWLFWFVMVSRAYSYSEVEAIMQAVGYFASVPRKNAVMCECARGRLSARLVWAGYRARFPEYFK